VLVALFREGERGYGILTIQNQNVFDFLPHKSDNFYGLLNIRTDGDFIDESA
jgi:hypothetical protein